MWSVGVIGQCVVSWCDGGQCDGVSVCDQLV